MAPAKMTTISKSNMNNKDDNEQKKKKLKREHKIETHRRDGHDWIDPDNDATDLSRKTMIACDSVARRLMFYYCARSDRQVVAETLYEPWPQRRPQRSASACCT